MNGQEKTLGAAIGAVVLLGVVWFLVHVNFIAPLRVARSRLISLDQDINDLQFTFDKYLAAKPKLDAARKRSLPANPQLAASQYNISYLQPLLAKSGLTVEDVTPSQPTEMKLATAIGDVKKSGHKLMTFQIRARGELSQLVNAIQTIQATPYEHRIKNLLIDRDGSREVSNKLTINMMIEVLLVAKSENKAAPPPEVDLALMNRRNYDDIAKKNIFLGRQPPETVVKWVIRELPPVKTPPKTEEIVVDNSPKPPEDDVLAYVRLVTTDTSNKEAFLRNILYGTRETKLIARAGSGYEFFRITDEVGDYVYFKAKVLRVAPREVYFQIYNQVYQLHLGDSIREALEYPLTIDQLDDIELDYDREWAKKEMAKKEEKLKTLKKKTTKGGR